MAQCPFCKGPVTEDLLRFGGNCPSCLILIPGEEAATDPGEEKRKAEDEAQRKQAESRVRRQHLLIGGVAAVFVAGVAVAILTREPPPTPLTLNIGEFTIAPFDASANVMAAPSEPVQGGSGGSAKSSGSGGRSSSGGGSSAASSGGGATASASAPPETNGSASAGTVATAATGGSPSSGSSGDPFAVALGGPKQRSANVTLRDENEIASMVVDVINVGQAQLKRCYEARLKENPKLRGTWEIGWVVTREGRVEDVSVRPRGSSDSELEGCMQRSVASWRFQPIFESMSIPPVPFKFGPSS